MSKINKLFNIYLGFHTLIKVPDFEDYDYELIMETVFVYWCDVYFWYISMIKSQKHSVMRCCVSLECQF